ncbi:hypothetical protein DOY81_003972, partial [Sarcophaga bullata]
DQKLQQIFKIRPLQTNCIAYRSSTNEYRKMLKQTCVSELKNLVNVEMKIEQVQLKIPNEEEIPQIPSDIRTTKADYLLEECSRVEEGLRLL